MDQRPSKSILSDHVKIKRKLLSPFRAALGGKYAPYSWARDLVPEAIWLSLVIDRLGFNFAVKTMIALVNAIKLTDFEDTAPPFARLSSFSILKSDQTSSIKEKLGAEAIRDLRDSLSPLSSVIPDHPLRFIAVGDDAQGGDQSILSHVLDEVYDRNSRLSVLSMALAYYMHLEQGKLHISSHLAEMVSNNLSSISDYPDSEKSRLAASSFRAAAPMLFQSPIKDDLSEGASRWATTFWDHIAGYGDCNFPDTILGNSASGSQEDTSESQKFIGFVMDDLHARLEAWPLNLENVEFYEVICALIARQTTITVDIAKSPQLWTPHSASILLRAMADVFITVAWIFKKPQERALAFIEDGLGAVKLMIAHQEKAILQTSDEIEIERMQQALDVWRIWLRDQRIDAFVEVNLGSWSGISTRKMAEEAGFIDFYNYVYQPFSSAVHSNWFHVSMFNSVHCSNPAHRNHRVAAIAPLEPDMYWLYLATKYLKKTFSILHTDGNIPAMRCQSYDFITGLMDSISDPDTRSET